MISDRADKIHLKNEVCYSYRWKCLPKKGINWIILKGATMQLNSSLFSSIESMRGIKGPWLILKGVWLLDGYTQFVLEENAWLQSQSHAQHLHTLAARQHALLSGFVFSTFIRVEVFIGSKVRYLIWFKLAPKREKGRKVWGSASFKKSAQNLWLMNY